MSILDKIKTDLETARRNGKKKTAMILNVLYADALKIGKDKRNDLPTDAECIQSAKRISKSCCDTISFLGGNSASQNLQISELQSEVEILSEYLPKQISKAECIAEIKKFDGANISSIMKHFKENFADQYNGKDVSLWINQLRNLKEI